MQRLSSSEFDSCSMRLLLALTCCTLMSGCIVLAPRPTITDHLDNFVVMETHRKDYEVNALGMIRMCREFYQHYEDAVDVQVFVSQAQDGFSNKWGRDV
ncbi:MAG: hypothetical protein F4X56_00230 [Gammaproteobacteria bacterium]|nr:hypothetical protein [Gammaproteobacteria bacterium]